MNCGLSSCSAATLTSATCDGTGDCGIATESPCAGDLICADANQCKAKCAVPSDCLAGEVCDGFGRKPTCCVAPGATIYVDNGTGVDAACCGSATSPCQTLTRAMNEIATTELLGAVIQATVSGAGGDWTVETAFPVTLGWGVTLVAPGIYFHDTTGVGSGVFDVSATSAADTSGTAAISGTGPGTDQIVVGSDTQGNLLGGQDATIAVESGMTLYIANAWVNGGDRLPNAIHVKAGGTLFIGQDLAGNPGQLTIGGDLPNGTSPAFLGGLGIVCDGTLAQPAVVSDQVLHPPDAPSVQISHQNGGSISAADFCTVDLENAPVIGIVPAGGFQSCVKDGADKSDWTGLSVGGNAAVTFGSAKGPAVVQCIQDTGVGMWDTGLGNGGGSLKFIGLIRNTTYGLVASYGTATLLDTTFQYNFIAVTQSGSASVDLSGNGGANPNTVICDSSSEHEDNLPGVGVWNEGTNSLAADNVLWDHSPPDYFDCDSLFTACSCNLTTCTTTAGSDGMDAAEDPAVQGGITMTNPSLSPDACP